MMGIESSMPLTGVFYQRITPPKILQDSSIIQGPDGKLGYHCFHNHCSQKTWQDARRTISGNESLAQFCHGYVSSSTSLEKPKNPSIRLEDALLNADDLIRKEIPSKRKF